MRKLESLEKEERFLAQVTENLWTVIPLSARFASIGCIIDVVSLQGD